MVEEKYQLADYSWGIAPGFGRQTGLDSSLGLPGNYFADYFGQCIYDGARINGRAGRAAGGHGQVRCIPVSFCGDGRAATNSSGSRT